MKSSKLLDELSRLIGLTEDADKKELKRLHKVLKALREKERKLESKLETAEGEHERRSIRQRLEVIRQQRQKGVDVYRSIKRPTDNGTSPTEG